MKKSPYLFSLLAILFSVGASAYTEINCVKDQRAVDGERTQVTFTKDDNQDPEAHQYYSIETRVTTADLSGSVIDNRTTDRDIMCVCPTDSQYKIQCNDFPRAGSLKLVPEEDGQGTLVFKFSDSHSGYDETFIFAESECTFR